MHAWVLLYWQVLCYVSDDCVYSATSNDNISIVSDKFWDKIVRAIFRHFKDLSLVRPQPKGRTF